MIDRAMAALILAAICFVAGFVAAWAWQGGKHRDYVRTQEALVEQINRDNAARQQIVGNAWAANLERLRSDNDAYRRCVAAGRCGAVVRDRVLAGSCETGASAPGPETDGAGAGSVPPAAGDATSQIETAEDPSPGLTEDCRRAVLTANALQEAIEAQEGY